MSLFKVSLASASWRRRSVATISTGARGVHSRFAPPPHVPVTRTGEDTYPDVDGDFNKAPYFNFNDGKLKFDTNWIDNANDNYGSASAFLSQ